jgi:hypothetical protein
LEAVYPGFIAYPLGEQFAPYARIDHSESRNSHNTWHWWVYWPGRFHQHGMATNKQEAADKATSAWHEALAVTSTWTLPAEPLVPPIIDTLPKLTDDELQAVVARYFRAVGRGDSGIESDRSRDQMVYSAARRERERRGWKPAPGPRNQV